MYYFVLFASIGATAPFLALWLKHLDIDSAMIGVIVAAPSIVMVLTTVRIGRWADSLGDLTNAIIIGNWLILLLHLFLLLTGGTWLILVIWTLSGIVKMAKVPIFDAASLSLTIKRNSDFARVRVFGSIGYVVAVSASGVLYEHIGIVAFLPILIVGDVARIVLSYRLPPMRRNDEKKPPVLADVPPTDNNTSLYQTGILLVIAGAALINASHAVYYTFGILIWIEQGLSESVSSLLFSAGVVTEILLMWRFKTVAKKLSARACLLVAGGCTVVRWLVMGASPGLLILMFTQLLHGITFGLVYLATASFIARRVDERDAARGQSLSASIFMGCLASVIFISGLLFDDIGEKLYWVMAGLCIVGMLLVYASFRTKLVD